MMENLMERKHRFGAYEGTFVYIIAILANMLVQGVASVILSFAMGISEATGGSSDDYYMTLSLIFMILIQVSFGITYYLLIVKKKQKLLYAPVINKEKKSLTALALTPLLGIGALLAFYPLAIFYAMLLEAIGYSSTAMQFTTPFQHVLAVFVLVIMAPIFEELIFRGALLSGLKREISTHKAVFFSALLFMLMHMNPDQTVYQFMLGLVMGYAAVLTKTVIAPMIIHATSNLIAYLLEVTALGTAVNTFIDSVAQNPVVGVLVAIAFIIVFSGAILGILLLIKKLCKDVADVEPEYELQENTLGESKLDITADTSDEPTVVAPKKPAPRKKAAKNYKLMIKIGIGLCLLVWFSAFLLGLFADEIAALLDPELPEGIAQSIKSIVLK